jgi:O-antigen/teichoic acid export membrane protein
MITQALITTFAVFFGMALNYVFHFLMTRFLSPALYGELAFIIGILTILLVPTGSIQTLMAREIAKLDNKNKKDIIVGLIKKFSKTILFASLVLSIMLFFSSYLIVFIFKDSQLLLPIQIVSFGIPFCFLAVLVKAYYQGREKIFKLSIILISDPIIKLILAIALVSLGFGLFGATFSLWASSLFISLLIIPIILKKVKPFKYSINLGNSFILILSASILMMIFFYLDLFFVRYYLGSEQSGYYNVASITSKVLYYAVGGITMVFLPKSSKLSISKDRKKLKELIGKSILLLLPLFLIFILFPKRIISLFYTEKYLVALDSFIVLSLGMFALGISHIFVNLFWSQRMEKIPLVISSIVVLFDFLLLNYLVPKYGLLGASISTSISSLLFLLPSIAIAFRYLK